VVLALVAAAFAATAAQDAAAQAPAPRPVSYFVERALAAQPSNREITEIIRIARSIDPDMNGMEAGHTQNPSADLVEGAGTASIPAVGGIAGVTPTGAQDSGPAGNQPQAPSGHAPDETAPGKQEPPEPMPSAVAPGEPASGATGETTAMPNRNSTRGSGSESDEFLGDYRAQLRAEVRGAYAALAATRGEAAELKRSIAALAKLVELSTTLYAEGKIDQARALGAQVEYENERQALLALESRARIFSIRLNVLSDAAPQDPVGEIAPLAEFAPAFDDRELREAFKSRRFTSQFQQLLGQTFTENNRAPHVHGADLPELEADAYVSAARAALEARAALLRRLRLSSIPRAEQAYAARLDAYAAGRLDFEGLVESARDVIAARRQYQELLGDLHAIKSRLEAATGVDLDAAREP
jgi:outer membrane protein TolC